MNRGVREIADPSRVVEVEMRWHDVADVAGAKSQIHHLPERRLGDVEPWPHHRVEQKSEPPRLVDILDPKAGVDQDQPVLALDQEAVAAHGRGRQRTAAPPNSFPPRGQSEPQLR